MKKHTPSSRATTASAAARPATNDKERFASLLEFERLCNFNEFGSFIATARFMWRKHRALIESPEIPEPYASAFLEVVGKVPEETNDKEIPENVFAVTYPDNLRERCKKKARAAA